MIFSLELKKAFIFTNHQLLDAMRIVFFDFLIKSQKMKIPL